MRGFGYAFFYEVSIMDNREINIKLLGKAITDILHKHAEEFNLDVSTVVATKEALILAEIIGVMQEKRYSEREVVDIIARILRSNGLISGEVIHEQEMLIFK